MKRDRNFEQRALSEESDESCFVLVMFVLFSE